LLVLRPPGHVPRTTTFFQLFPALPYREDEFWNSVSGVFGLVCVIALIYPVISATRLIVLEKDRRIRAAMVMMSMKLAPLYASWLALYTAMALVVAVLMTLACLIPPGIFLKSDLSVVFVLFLLTVQSSYSFAFFLAAFFRDAKLAVSALAALARWSAVVRARVSV
jgi:ATP-binding cassette subfamily A (ABC1) protein 3